MLDILKPILEYTILVPVVHAASTTASTSSGVSGVITLLGVNWKLLIAQLVNFAIVFFVLWKWVFTPLSAKLAERTARIQESMDKVDDINKMHRDAEIEKAELIRAARQEASAIVTASETAANVLKEEILSEAKTQSQKVFDDGRKQLLAEQHKLLEEVRSQAALFITAATEKILDEKLDKVKDRSLIERVIADLDVPEQKHNEHKERS